MKNEDFMDAFRELDTEIKAQGFISVNDYEATMPDGSLEKEELKVCRIMRNFMAHNNMTFLTASMEQVKFLNNLTTELRKKAHTVKDEMKRVKTVTPSTPIKDMLQPICKFPIIPMELKDGSLYLITKDIILENLANGNKKIEVPKKLPKYSVTDKLEKIENLTSGVYIVMDKSAYVGIICI